MDGVKAFSFKELQAVTSRFSIATQVGEGGYGNVFKGTLVDGTVVAIKRAEQGSLQGDKKVLHRDRNVVSFTSQKPSFIGSTRGILYLHTEADPPIIHHDIKANNIMLDSKWTAKVSDFGISMLAPVSDIKGVTVTHISTNVKGTLVRLTLPLGVCKGY
ncbi:probable LRR receptor-like serine threonine-kinase At1g06840 isoform X1 [Olea europaea subsp. europaea]|uniref:Probable LRR receptor-like serine threonine-kinase At1g06840 isoform X1 n=1 Tax=Olea europaea subsp. europaea TaxID=158383 RepID=A0A8S0SFJ3_OLEEU|nr:probable LRR receptor-like serine threonine-kinase At1g06840 isoform X1 [Olea europaea subsp. europaea]